MLTRPGDVRPPFLTHFICLACQAHVDCYLYHLQFFTFGVVVNNPKATCTPSGPGSGGSLSGKETWDPCPASSDVPWLICAPPRYWDSEAGRSSHSKGQPRGQICDLSRATPTMAI